MVICEVRRWEAKESELERGGSRDNKLVTSHDISWLSQCMTISDSQVLSLESMIISIFDISIFLMCGTVAEGAMVRDRKL